MGVDYDHSQNVHTLTGARCALSVLLGGRHGSLLDVGCGTGTWLCAAVELGMTDVFGIDAVDVAPDKFHAPKGAYRQLDFMKPFRLDRRFDIVLCLEVAEHLPAAAAEPFIGSLVEHGDTILFSAACPNQLGQHHVNCQWPEYWQTLFNSRGYVCEDSPRWWIWRDSRIEPWYRQNVFAARKDPGAGTEPRIQPVLHPDMWPYMDHGSPRPFSALLRRMVKRGRALSARSSV